MESILFSSLVCRVSLKCHKDKEVLLRNEVEMIVLQNVPQHQQGKPFFHLLGLISLLFIFSLSNITHLLAFSFY